MGPRQGTENESPSARAKPGLNTATNPTRHKQARAEQERGEVILAGKQPERQEEEGE